MIRLLLERLKSHESAWPFLEPVDPEKHGCPNYFHIIKTPMGIIRSHQDLSLIEDNISNGSIQNQKEFCDQFVLMISNCCKFNPKTHNVHKAGLVLAKFFEKQIGATINWNESGVVFKKNKNRIDDSVNEQSTEDLVRNKAKTAGKAINQKTYYGETETLETSSPKPTKILKDPKPKKAKVTVEYPAFRVERGNMTGNFKQLKPEQFPVIKEIVKSTKNNIYESLLDNAWATINARNDDLLKHDQMANSQQLDDIKTKPDPVIAASGSEKPAGYKSNIDDDDYKSVSNFDPDHEWLNIQGDMDLIDSYQIAVNANISVMMEQRDSYRKIAMANLENMDAEEFVTNYDSEEEEGMC